MHIPNALNRNRSTTHFLHYFNKRPKVCLPLRAVFKSSKEYWEKKSFHRCHTTCFHTNLATTNWHNTNTTN